ncbi:hypothetical protein AVEN_271559-1 [Araneus ventricosus]|uniref:Uncharacterized protein n=1 Tax=Araneus ventricosus TaxID=182803 RepID=A0A4Y2M1K6_ARAVE|nr:hypothetical protein AVEN_271559-1 [Araneus ventricosus]
MSKKSRAVVITLCQPWGVRMFVSHFILGWSFTIAPRHANATTPTPKLIVNVQNRSEWAWCGMEDWISNPSQYPSLHLDCCTIKALAVRMRRKREILGVRVLPRKWEKTGIGMIGSG